MKQIVDHSPVVRMPDAAKSMGLPPDAVNVIQVGALGNAKCFVCERRVDEHSGPIEFQDEHGRPIVGRQG